MIKPPVKYYFFSAFKMAVIFLPFLFSCKTKEWAPPAIHPAPLSFDYQFINNNLLKYERFAADFDADYSSGGVVTSFSGQIRIFRDSFIWISASAVLGIEVSRMLVTQDSFWMIDRVHNTYLRTGFSFLRKQTHPSINISILQALLTGNDIPGFATGGFTAKCANNNCEMVCTERKNLSDTTLAVFSKIAFNKQTGKITSQDISATDPKTDIHLEYFDHETHAGQLVPAIVKASVSGERQQFLSLSYKNVKINVVQKVPFKIPEKYTPMN